MENILEHLKIVCSIAALLVFTPNELDGAERPIATTIGEDNYRWIVTLISKFGDPELTERLARALGYQVLERPSEPEE